MVRVEVGGGERTVGDGERRVGDGGCQGCYDVVRDSRPLLRRERPRELCMHVMKKKTLSRL